MAAVNEIVVVIGSRICACHFNPVCSVGEKCGLLIAVLVEWTAFVVASHEIVGSIVLQCPALLALEFRVENTA